MNNFLNDFYMIFINKDYWVMGTHLHLVGLSSIPPVSVNRQEILADYRYLGHTKILIHMKTPSW